MVINDLLLSLDFCYTLADKQQQEHGSVVH